MKFSRITGLHSKLPPALEREFQDRTSEWINKTFRISVFIISFVMWSITMMYVKLGFESHVLKLALGGQILLIYAYMTTMLTGASRRIFNKLTFVFPLAFIYAFMGYYVPNLSSESLVYQSQGWIVWVIMLIYAVERLSPVSALLTALATSVLYFYLRFQIPQFQNAPYIQVLVQVAVTNLTGFFIVSDHTSNARRQFKLEKELEKERAAADTLLKNVLPISIVGELKSQSSTVAHTYDNVTVLFADLVDFTKTAASMESKILVKLIDELFSRFDALAEKQGIEKIKTIGDAYMAAAGCPESDREHALRMTTFALELDNVVHRFNQEFGTIFKIKAGLSSGSVIGGVIGKKRISFDLWGDTVNLASRIESIAGSGDVLVGQKTAELIKAHFQLSAQKIVDLKGKGPTPIYAVIRDRKVNVSKDDPKPIPTHLPERPFEPGDQPVEHQT